MTMLSVCIERTIAATVDLRAGDDAQSTFASQCKDWAALGIQHLFFNMPTYQDTSLIRHLCDTAIGEFG